MKTNLLIMLVLISFALIQISGCKKESKSKINTPPDYGSLILGKWSLVIDKDEVYHNGTLIKTTIDTVSDDIEDFTADTVEHVLIDGKELLFKTVLYEYKAEQIPLEYYIQSDTIILYQHAEGGAVAVKGTIKSITANSMEIDIPSQYNGNTSIEYSYYTR